VGHRVGVYIPCQEFKEASLPLLLNVVEHTVALMRRGLADIIIRAGEIPRAFLTC
jgi:hypothetical protein